MNAEGVVTKASPLPVDDTVRRLVGLLDAHHVTVVSIVDHSGEAAGAGFTMPNTKLVIFGNPAAGTPVMLARPHAALDLPLKILVWEDTDGAAWVSYNAPSYLEHRYDLAADVAAPLAAVETIADALVAPVGEQA
jgi:uncharacterized protein (DUF302 family)